MRAKEFDSAFGALIDLTQAEQAIAEGLHFCEGPVWSAREDCLYFNDIPASKTWRYRAGEGARVAFENEHKSNGMCLAPDGKLLLCEHATSSLVERDADGGGRRVLAERYGAVELNSPNDVVVRSDGLVYFSDPVFGRSGNPTSVLRPIPSDMRPVYCLDRDSGTLLLAADGFGNPNGLCFSPDEGLLYVNDTPRHRIMVFAVRPDGTLDAGRLFAETVRSTDEGTGPDGMKADSAGNVICACLFAGVQWYSPAGKCLGVVELPEKALNLAFGGADLMDLYVTCEHHVYRLRTKVPGARLPGTHA